LALGRQQEFRIKTGVQLGLADDDIGVGRIAKLEPVGGQGDAFIGEFELTLGARR